MKIIFNRRDLIAMTSLLMSSVSGKTTVTSTEGILIETLEGGQCRMTSYDLEKGIRGTIDAQIMEEGSCIVNAQKFFSAIKVMDGDEIELNVDINLRAQILSEKSQYSMPATDASTFSEIPRLTSNNEFSLKQSDLRRMIEKVMLTMAQNDSRPFLNGTYMKVDNGILTLVSCDSFRLSKISEKIEITKISEEIDELAFEYIIPGKTVNELYRQLSTDEEQTVKIMATRKNIIFTFENYLMFSKLIDGRYLEYERMIVKNHPIKVVANKEELLAAFERSALVTEERIPGQTRSHVKIDLEGELLKVSAVSSVGSSYDEIVVSHEGDDISIAFNNRYLLDALHSFDCEEISISMTSRLASINIEPTDQSLDQICMILPVRVS